MSIFDDKSKTDGGYIFISHSHRDIGRIRDIRNRLEAHGFEPLCFYLKCLSDDSEIEDLIKREIDARDWFLYADSENARNSRWVRMERDYIESTDGNKIISVELDDEKAVARALDTILRNLRIFISYTRPDGALARRINDRLKRKDYLTFFDMDDLRPGDSFADALRGAIADAAENGAVLFLVSQAALRSTWTMHEITKAAELGGRIIPVVVDDALMHENDPPLSLPGARWYFLGGSPTDEEIDAVIDRIGDAIVGG